MSKRVPQTLSPRPGWREGSEDLTVRRGRRPPRQRDPHAEEEMSNSQKGLPNAKSEEAPQGPPKHKGGGRAHPNAELEEMLPAVAREPQNQI